MKNYLEVIKKIKNSKDIFILDIYKSKNQYWEYYIHLISYYNDNYFSIKFFKGNYELEGTVKFSHNSEKTQ
jgi:hypothetical protein